LSVSVFIDFFRKLPFNASSYRLAVYRYQKPPSTAYFTAIAGYEGHKEFFPGAHRPACSVPS
jgi:hypothetical protein